MGWCSLWRGNWGSASSARSTTGSATLTSRMVAPLRLRSLPPRPRLLRSTCRPRSRRRCRPRSPGLRPARSSRPRSGAASSAKRSTTTIKPSPIPAPAAISGGFQGGIDLLRGSLIAGHYERAGLYGAYGDVHADVNGLVTNPAATAYVLSHTGSMNLNSWSAGGYWTHVGPGGWYLDAVLQGTWYYGSASTQFARLNTDGTGFIALPGGRLSILLAATRAGVRDRAAGADPMAEGVVPARL